MNASIASDAELLAPLRLAMIRVALTLGWVSGAVVVVDALAGPQHQGGADRDAIIALVLVAASVNGALGLLPWRRWMGTSRAEQVLALWAGAVIVLVSVFVHLSGGWAGDDYLLYFLVVPFVAATETLPRQAFLYAMVLAGYLVAVVSVQGPHPAGALAVRLVVLAGACTLSGFLAHTISQSIRSRARAEAAARTERLLADEAHHRIKNNLQLIADLLSMEAAKEDRQVGEVVAETLSRIQSVAAVHQALAAGAEGKVTLRPVVDRIVGLLAERLGGRRPVEVAGGEGFELAGRRATWAALVVNELVTNALRHGRGRVSVGLATTREGMTLRVHDEGTGPAKAQPGLGLALVDRLVQDGLGGTIAPHGTPQGWEMTVMWPHDAPPPSAGAWGWGPRRAGAAAENGEPARAGTDRRG